MGTDDAFNLDDYPERVKHSRLPTPIRPLSSDRESESPDLDDARAYLARVEALCRDGRLSPNPLVVADTLELIALQSPLVDELLGRRRRVNGRVTS